MATKVLGCFNETVDTAVSTPGYALWCVSMNWETIVKPSKLLCNTDCALKFCQNQLELNMKY